MLQKITTASSHICPCETKKSTPIYINNSIPLQHQFKANKNSTTHITINAEKRHRTEMKKNQTRQQAGMSVHTQNGT
jgi:hypothetical protein